MVTTVTVKSGEELAELRTRATDSTTIGRIVARTLEAQSQRTFLEQKLGDFAWPERYPNMEDPFVNIASLVNWLNQGGNIVPRLFDRRPALMGRGILAGSISAAEQNGIVTVSSSETYAADHQWGGTSTQPITVEAKKKLATYLGSEKRDGKWQMKRKLTDKQKRQRDKYGLRLMQLLRMDQIETQVNQRPFLGITDENEQDMAETIEAWVATGEA